MGRLGTQSACRRPSALSLASSGPIPGWARHPWACPGAPSETTRMFRSGVLQDEQAPEGFSRGAAGVRHPPRDRPGSQGPQLWVLCPCTSLPLEMQLLTLPGFPSLPPSQPPPPVSGPNALLDR